MKLKAVRASAEKLAEQAGAGTPPVEVEEIARALGLRVIYQYLGPDVSGLLVAGPAGACIVVQESDSEHRKPFTIAHEIGHYCLRHQFVPGEHVHVDHGHYVTQRGPRSSTGLDPKEIEANQFAAALLMPTGQIESAVRNLQVPYLRDDHVSRLANDFRVSEQAMTIRLTSMGLL